MGSEVRGPGPPGLPHVAAPVARAWAVAAATAAVRVPAGNAEADAWTVRGWADVAVGCVALDGPGFAGPGRRLARRDGPGAFSGLDDVIRSLRVVSGGQHAARLRQLRRFAGPVPPWYPDTSPVAGPIRDVRDIVWRAAELVTGFGDLLMTTAATLRHDAACPLVSARQLAWGVRRPADPGRGLPARAARRAVRWPGPFNLRRPAGRDHQVPARPVAGRLRRLPARRRVRGPRRRTGRPSRPRPACVRAFRPGYVT
jgi:hypothetical protein